MIQPTGVAVKMHNASSPNEFSQLASDIKRWGDEAGFAHVAITDINLEQHEKHLQAWLARGDHGSMDYMARHGNMRSRPDELLPGTMRVISCRLDYLPADVETVKTLQQPDTAYISRYALGRDYHKLIRKRLATLAKKIEAASGGEHRAFVDSAPVLERALAEQAGLGWIGKNTMLINSQAGSLFFLGEIYTSLPLPVDQPQQTSHCGSCTSCLDKCPTDAFRGAYQLDARKCISYLTIENSGAIPVELRAKIGNRVYGCDDCQLVCPWTKFTKFTKEQDFHPRQQLDKAKLCTLFNWSETEFLSNTEGSPIRRIGYQSWLRNIAVGLGNAPTSIEVIETLKSRLDIDNDMVKEHIEWALSQHI
jgi:epoxyqueuosine reductase